MKSTMAPFVTAAIKRLKKNLSGKVDVEVLQLAIDSVKTGRVGGGLPRIPAVVSKRLRQAIYDNGKAVVIYSRAKKWTVVSTDRFLTMRETLKKNVEMGNGESVSS